MSRAAAFTVGALIAAYAGYAGAVETVAPVAVSGSWKVLSHSYPPDALPTGFAVAQPGFVLVPYRGGVVVAGWNGWFLDPTDPPIVEIAAGADSRTLYALRDRSRQTELVIYQREGRKWTSRALGSMPRGRYHLVPFPDGTVWIHGSDAKNRPHLYRATATGVSPKANLEKDVTAMVPLGPQAATIATENALVLWRRRGVSRVLRRLASPVDGLAVDKDGSLFCSTSSGVYRVSATRPAELVSRGVHGPMLVRHGNLYVMWRERHQVVELTPR